MGNFTYRVVERGREFEVSATSIIPMHKFDLMNEMKLA